MWGTIRHYLPAVATGILLSLCFPRFQIFPLAFVSLVPLLWRAKSLTPLQAADANDYGPVRSPVEERNCRMYSAMRTGC